MSPRKPRGRWRRPATSGRGLLAGLLLAESGPAVAAEWIARSGNVEVVVEDTAWARRAGSVARWLAETLDAALPDDLEYRLAVRRTRLSGVPATLDGTVLVLDTAAPRSSRDERLRTFTLAAYAALLPGHGPAEAWRIAGELARARYPRGWEPAFLPRCCPGEDALLASDGPSSPPATAPDPRPAPHAELWGGVAWPPMTRWPWAVGLAGLAVPVGGWSVAGALEVWPSDLVEARLGAGRYLGIDAWSRVEAGPLVAWRPEGEALPIDGAPDEAGVWVRALGWGFDVTGRAVHAPGEEGAGVALGAIARGRWEVPVGDHLAVIPGLAGAGIAGVDPWRQPTLGALPGGVRWMPWDRDPAALVAAVRLDAEAWVPVGRLPGPSALRPRTVVLRAGGDMGWSTATGWVPGLAAAVGLSGNPWREYRGTVFLQAATPPDLSTVDLTAWVSIRER